MCSLKMTGLLGKKLGMTQVFSEDGRQLSVTVIEAGPCPILAVKEKSIQLGFDARVVGCKFIREVSKEPDKDYKKGEELKVELFKVGDFVDVTGVSKGKGFQGGMKRWNWRGGPQTHGSTSHRRIGSLGSSTTPGRVWKGHHLPGHMGARKFTIQNLQIVKVDAQNNLLLIKGPVPGAKNSYLVIRRAKKKWKS